MDNESNVLRHYDGLGRNYGTAESDSLFHWVRQREMRMVMELLAPRAGEEALDVGCGPGLYSRMLGARGLQVTAVDFSPAMVEAVRPHVHQAIQARVEGLDLGRRFDRILCLGVLEFVTDPERCFADIAGHLAAGGRLVVLGPRLSLGGGIYWLKNRRLGIQVHLHRPDTFEAVARRCGLRRAACRYPFLHNLVLAYDRPAAVDH